VGQAQLEGGPGPRHTDGRRVRHRGAARQHHRAPQGAPEEVAVLEDRIPDSPRRGSRGAAGGRGLPAARPRRHATQARGRRAAGAHSGPALPRRVCLAPLPGTLQRGS
jgi:hypothetical protein